MANCIICDTELIGESASREHIIPEKLGGHRTCRTVLCRRCNNETGTEWDAKPIQELSPYYLWAFPETNRLRQNSRRRVRDAQGNEVVMRGGIPDGTDRPQIVENDGEKLVIAHTNKRARQEVERLGRTGELPGNAILETMPQGSGGQPQVELTIDMDEASKLGTPDACKSVLKSMITASAMGGFEREDIGRAIRHLRNEGRGVLMLRVRESAMRSAAGRRYGLRRRRSWVCVHVESDEAEHRVWGYVELFGTFKWIAVIGEKALTVRPGWTYCSDAPSGRTLGAEVTIDLGDAKKMVRRWEIEGGNRKEIEKQQSPVGGCEKPRINGEHKIWGLTSGDDVFSQIGRLVAGSSLPAMNTRCVRTLGRVTRRAGAQRRSREEA